MTPRPDDIPVTEQENARTRDISTRSTADMLRLINDEDTTVPAAVGRETTQIALAVDGIVERLRHGGRLFYVGTGTSGRLGVLDASECPPTFGVSPDLVQGVIAGGYEACHRAVEASEDDRAAGAHDLEARGVTSRDAVVGIAASGRTPYTIGAVSHARSIGAFTAAIACVPESPITAAVDVAIVPVVGPEVLAGSTRMKAGTAQKLVLNMLSTATMMRLGYVSGNRMTNLRARNSKLQARSVRILAAEAGIDEGAAAEILERAGGELPTAVVMARAGCPASDARAALDASGGVIAAAVERLTPR
jgi:N-acetylmuramic acid 6-phosphate etherase